MKTKSLLLLMAFILLLAPAGCIFSPDDGDDTGTPTPGTDIPFAGSEDILMTNFRTAYENMDFDTYRDLLHPDFITILQTSTQEEFPDVGATLDLSEELRIAERMFTGDPVNDPNGNLVPGISSISFQNFDQDVTWADSQPSDVIPNARFALYQVVFLFDRPGFSTLRVEGQIKFYVSGRDSLHAGRNQTYWQMVGQQDLTDSE